ncbi:hypothetical protein ACFLWA_12365, partial [Chloroflexota bacterium]
ALASPNVNENQTPTRLLFVALSICDGAQPSASRPVGQHLWWDTVCLHARTGKSKETVYPLIGGSPE